MKWSLKLVRIAGIDVYIHATFFILIAWAGLTFWFIAGNLSAVISGVSFILVLFACVVMHEYGHALTARRYGILTLHITLLPIGGVASMEKMPDDPKQEILVALAGPAVNLVIAFVLWLWLVLSNTLMPLAQFSFTEGSFAERIMLINLVLAVFNLIPAFPMDGGRVLRAVLAMRMNHNKATQLAARVGKALALCLGFLGLLYNPFLILIALFVWIGATGEAATEDVKSIIKDMTAGRAMLTDFEVLSADDSLSRAIKLTLGRSQKDFPVMNDANIVGVLTQDNLLQGLHEYGERTYVQDCMERGIESADIDEPLEKILQRLQNGQCRLLPVTEAGQLVGIINMDNITELISIEKAMRDEHSQAHWKA